MINFLDKLRKSQDNAERKIKAIYKKIADKNLSLRRKIKRQWNYYTVIEWRNFIYEKTWNI